MSTSSDDSFLEERTDPAVVPAPYRFEPDTSSDGSNNSTILPLPVRSLTPPRLKIG